MIAYVGDGKLIDRVAKSDVIFHAKRGLQEFSYDVLKTVKIQNDAMSFRVRLNIFRKDGGLYTPKTNEINYSIEVSETNVPSMQ